MATDDEPTVSFGVSKFLMSVEGASSMLGVLVGMLYEDAALSRKDWSVSHTAANRPEFVRQLRAAGAAPRRIGIAVHTQEAVDRISLAAKRLRLAYHCLTTHADRD